MRGYQCHFWAKVDGQLRASDFTDCWGGVMGSSWFFHKKVQDEYKKTGVYPSGFSGTDHPFKNQDIWIDKWKEPETEAFAPELVSVINDITPCQITEDGLIQIRLLETYRQSLLLLNFIRNLWHEPCDGYTGAFFKSLVEDKGKYPDPLARLTWANKCACKASKFKNACGVGHSNAMTGWNSLTIRLKPHLLAAQDMRTTECFLTEAA